MISWVWLSFCLVIVHSSDMNQRCVRQYYSCDEWHARVTVITFCVSLSCSRLLSPSSPFSHARTRTRHKRPQCMVPDSRVGRTPARRNNNNHDGCIPQEFICSTAHTVKHWLHLNKLVLQMLKGHTMPHESFLSPVNGQSISDDLCKIFSLLRYVLLVFWWHRADIIVQIQIHAMSLRRSKLFTVICQAWPLNCTPEGEVCYHNCLVLNDQMQIDGYSSDVTVTEDKVMQPRVGSGAVSK